MDPNQSVTQSSEAMYCRAKQMQFELETILKWGQDHTSFRFAYCTASTCNLEEFTQTGRVNSSHIRLSLCIKERH